MSDVGVTADELEGLPQYAVVRDRDTDIWVKTRSEGGVEHPWRMIGAGEGEDPYSSATLHDYHPITVLATPSAPKAAPATQEDLVRVARAVTDAFWAEENKVSPALLDAMISLRTELSTLEER